MSNTTKTNPVYQKIAEVLRRNPTISNTELSQINFGIAASSATVYASQIRRDLGVAWDASTKTFISRRRSTQVIEAPAAVIFAPVTPAGKIKALLEAAQQGYAEAEVRRTALLAEVAAADAAVSNHLRRIDELTMTASLPENVWKVISEISR